MTIAEIITEIGAEIGRSDIDAKILTWIQRASNRVYMANQWTGLHKTYTFDSVASQRAYDLPGYYGKIQSVAYDEGGGTGHQLRGLTLPFAQSRYHGSTTEGIPYFYWLNNNKINLEPVPAAAYSMTIELYMGSPNLYIHDINLTDSDTTAADGVAIYLDEDAISTGVGKLYFVSPTTTDALIRIAAANNHYHTVTVYHSADAATLGVQVYFDEDGSNENERLQFVSPTNTNCVVQTNPIKEHTHYVQFVDSDGAAVDGVAVYLDEDVASQAARLLFISPTDTDGTAELILAPGDGIPPFIEAYHEVIYLKILQYGQLWNRRYAEAKEIAGEFNRVLVAVIDHDGYDMGIRPATKGWEGGSSANSNRIGEWWTQPHVKS